MKQLSKYTLAQLTKSRALLIGCLIGIGLLWQLVIIVFLYLYFFKDQAVPFFVLLILPTTSIGVFISLKSLNNEIKSRTLKTSHL
ncbi:hypothetical protein [Pedobacter sp. UC225_65]|uniref:hypothetical protein n=1 Tax=Pedobacter sp. UC225_65 TaxID=3350173 RepID=UPI0036712D1C